MNSHLPQISQPAASLGPLSRTSGVLPMRSSVFESALGAVMGGGTRRRGAGPQCNCACCARNQSSSAIVHLEAVELGGERNLARQAREFVAVVARIEQVVLVLAHRRQLVEERRVDVDVAGRARAAPAAQRQQLVEAVVADRLHHAEPVDGLDGRFFPGAGDDGQLGHFFRFPCGVTATRAAARQSPPVGKRREHGTDGGATARGLDAVAAVEPAICPRARTLAGYPEPRIRDAATAPCCARSSASRSAWRRRRACGASSKRCWARTCRPKTAGARFRRAARLRAVAPEAGLCPLAVRAGRAGALDLDALPADDEEAIAELTRIKGIGRWSAEIYLLFAEGRPDIWPAGDLAVQAGIGRDPRPAAKRPREAEARLHPRRRWPSRGARTAARSRS
jgi:DNA-3-methyladenine glycosylase II